MKTLVISTLALAAMTSVALAGAPAANKAKATAGPTKLTAAQMDSVSAGNTINGGTNFNNFNQGQQGFGQSQCLSGCSGNAQLFGNLGFGF